MLPKSSPLCVDPLSQNFGQIAALGHGPKKMKHARHGRCVDNMNCLLCKKDPFAHSFHYFGKTEQGESLYYTAPARATARETTQSFETMALHLQEVEGKPWIWVLDCSNMELHGMYTIEFSFAIAELLAKYHAKTLSFVLILYPNGWVRRVLSRLQDSWLDRIGLVDKDSELLYATKYLEFPEKATTWLMLNKLRHPNQYLDVVS